MEEEIYGVAVPTIMNSKSKLSALQKDFPWLNYVEGEGAYCKALSPPHTSLLASRLASLLASLLAPPLASLLAPFIASFIAPLIAPPLHPPSIVLLRSRHNLSGRYIQAEGWILDNKGYGHFERVQKIKNYDARMLFRP